MFKFANDPEFKKRRSLWSVIVPSTMTCFFSDEKYVLVHVVSQNMLKFATDSHLQE